MPQRNLGSGIPPWARRTCTGPVAAPRDSAGSLDRDSAAAALEPIASAAATASSDARAPMPPSSAAGRARPVSARTSGRASSVLDDRQGLARTEPHRGLDLLAQALGRALVQDVQVVVLV